MSAEPTSDGAWRAFAETAVRRLADDPDGTAGHAPELAELTDRLHLATTEDGGPHASLCRRAVLSGPEVELLAVLVAVEHDERLQRLIIGVTHDPDRHRVELGMLGRLVGVGPVAAGPGSGLLRAALVEPVQRGAFGRTQLRVVPRVLWALAGDPTPDPAYDGPLVRVTADVEGDGWPSVVVVGDDRIRRRQSAVGLLGRPECIVTGPPATLEGWRALVREATIGGYGVVVETDEDLSSDGRRCLEQSTHLSFALSSATRLSLESLPARDWREVEAGHEDPDDEEWAFMVGPEVERTHRLTATQLDAMSRAMRLTGGDPAASFRRLTDARLDRLARHVVPRAGWDDLVLSASRKGRLMDLANRYHSGRVVYEDWGFRASPSRGLVALFSGPSGTGKTMAAEIVAGQLGLDLYRLDLSSVVSKYIGETEKNLDELFDAASIGTTVLFFDEADALFGKRTEMSDSKDRYANVETSYLLQRLERYDGIVVLATNYEKNIDQAFLRRVHLRLDFPMPGQDERRELWRRALVAGAPQADDIDLDWLAAQFDLSGAAIRGAVLGGAFLAAHAGAPIAMAHLVRGVADELQKLGRRVTEGQFGTWYPAAVAVTS